MAPKKETTGKRGKSLTLTVGASESTEKDGDTDDLAVGPMTANSELVLQQSREIAVEALVDADDGVAIQGAENSTPGPQSEDMPTDEVGTVLLSISGSFNGFAVKVLIDSGASECFVGTSFAEKNGLNMTKTKGNSKYI